MIELKNISKVYKKGSVAFTALRDISIEIRKGDFCTVVGPSGAGKSTLLYIIGGLIHPDSGSVMYNGRNIYQMKDGDLNLFRREHIGFMFQQFYLMPYLTVIDNIRLGCREKKHFERIEYFLRKCSLAELKNKYPSELSVGEKQRTAFIRAIVAGPGILLADEPTGNLDPGNSETLLLLIKDFRSEGGTTVLVTHDPEMSKFASRNIMLEKGMISG
jgi:putative ABC transport system ATP-binding protein